MLHLILGFGSLQSVFETKTSRCGGRSLQCHKQVKCCTITNQLQQLGILDVLGMNRPIRCKQSQKFGLE